MAIQAMKVTVSASTGAKIQVWREQDLFNAAIQGEVTQPEMCLGVDLFEVVAELAGLDLEKPAQAAEATRLADQARSELAQGSSPVAPAIPGAQQESPEAESGHTA